MKWHSSHKCWVLWDQLQSTRRDHVDHININISYFEIYNCCWNFTNLFVCFMFCFTFPAERFLLQKKSQSNFVSNFLTSAKNFKLKVTQNKTNFFHMVVDSRIQKSLGKKLLLFKIWLQIQKKKVKTKIIPLERFLWIAVDQSLTKPLFFYIRKFLCKKQLSSCNLCSASPFVPFLLLLFFSFVWNQANLKVKTLLN